MQLAELPIHVALSLLSDVFHIMKQSSQPNSLQKLVVDSKCPQMPPDSKPSFFPSYKFQSEA